MANSLTNFIPEIWSREILRNYDNTTVMKGLVNTKYEGEIKAFGDVVQIRSFGDVTIKAYTKQMTLVMENLSPSIDTLTIDQAKYFAFEVDDLEQAQMDIDAISGYTARAAVAINAAVDSALIAKLYTDVDSGNVIGSDASLKNLATEDIYDHIVDLSTKLNNANMPTTGRSLVVPPAVLGVMLKNDLLVQANTSGDGGAKLRNGFIGHTVAGFDVYQSSNLVSVANSSSTLLPNVYNVIALVPDALTFASQVAKVEAIRPADRFTTVVRGLFLYGYATLVDHGIAVLKVRADNI